MIAPVVWDVIPNPLAGSVWAAVSRPHLVLGGFAHRLDVAHGFSERHDCVSGDGAPSTIAPGFGAAFWHNALQLPRKILERRCFSKAPSLTEYGVLIFDPLRRES